MITSKDRYWPQSIPYSLISISLMDTFQFGKTLDLPRPMTSKAQNKKNFNRKTIQMIAEDMFKKKHNNNFKKWLITVPWIRFIENSTVKDWTN